MLDDFSLKLYIFSSIGDIWLHISSFTPRKISLHNQKHTFKQLRCPLALLNAISHYRSQSTIGLPCPKKCLYIKYPLKLSSSNTSTKQDKQSLMGVTALQCEFFTIKQDFLPSKSVINRWLIS